MNKFIMMIGLPGSGKSFEAKKIAKKEKAVFISTDDIRKELFGDESIQKHHNRVFYEVYSRIDQAFKNKQHVVFDATNIEREKRMNVLKKFPDTYNIAVYMDTPYEACVKRNEKRKRTIDDRIMKKYRKKLEIPYPSEGFDEVRTVHEPHDYGMKKDDFIILLKSEPDYDHLFKDLKKIPQFNDILEFDQENPYHSLTLCRHTFQVFEYINAFYEEEEKLLFQVAALFHDLGKPFCKQFKPLKGHYSYYAHENVSAQIAYHFLAELNFEREFIDQAVGLIEMHMKIAYGGDEGAREIYHLLGADMLTKLYFFHEADVFAK